MPQPPRGCWPQDLFGPPGEAKHGHQFYQPSHSNLPPEAQHDFGLQTETKVDDPRSNIRQLLLLALNELDRIQGSVQLFQSLSYLPADGGYDLRFPRLDVNVTCPIGHVETGVANETHHEPMNGSVAKRDVICDAAKPKSNGTEADFDRREISANSMPMPTLARPIFSRGESCNSTFSDSSGAMLNKNLMALGKKMGGKDTTRRDFDQVDGDTCVGRTRRCFRQLKHAYEQPWFEFLFVGLICLNAFCMIAEFQYDGMQMSRKLGFKGELLPESDAPEKVLIFEVLELCFGIVFAAEFALKVLATGKQILRDCFALVDLIAVIFFLIERIGSRLLPVGSGWIRVCRLARMARLLRLVRTVEEFDHLYLMTTAIKGSVSILAWALLLLFTIQMTLALVIGQVLQVTYFKGDLEDTDISQKSEEDIKQIHKMFEYFGTWTRAMLSMFEITLANWPPICRMLTEEVSEWFTLVCLVHKLTVGFAVLGVINGVFMQETFKVASTDDIIMVRQAAKTMTRLRANMFRLFAALDTSGDGLVTRQEFKNLKDFAEIQTWLASMDLHVDEFGSMFDLIDEHRQGFLTYDDLFHGLVKMKGHARSIDLLRLMKGHAPISLSPDISTSRCESSGDVARVQNGTA